jgi:hypothetical protein
MELDLALLADAANVTREQKLNILGEYDTLISNQETLRLPPGSVLILRVIAHINELGAPHTVGVRLRDGDGNLRWSSPDLEVKFPEPEVHGLPSRCHIIAGIGGLPFPDEGSYEFEVSLDGGPARDREGHLARGATLHVVRRPPDG